MADLVLVMDEGRVVEQGGHDALMAADGRYARPYRMQERAYHLESSCAEKVR
jgi:ABC-type multidrug transport system fused ATPase/permease subunit